MKKLTLLLLCCAMLLCSCQAPISQENKQYTATFLELFDTVTTIKGYAESEEAFTELVTPIRDELEAYHHLFDIYNDYEGINNIKTLNDKAAYAPQEVDAVIIELLQRSKEYYVATDGKFNPAMGSVLSLWHKAREDSIDNPEEAYLPSIDELQEAAKHTNPEDIVIDGESSTVYFAAASLKLDVGAIAKGFAVQKVCENAPAGLLLSVGGNVCATGPKDEKNTPWAVGIRNPSNESENLHILNVTHGCVVTSGSYQRNFVFDGKLYHHIIDPDSLYPSELWTSVSVVCEDSGVADMLSTALFLLDKEAGLALLDVFGAEAVWVDADGNKYYSPNFSELIKT